MKSQLFRFFGNDLVNPDNDPNPFKLHPVLWGDGRIVSPAVSDAFGSHAWKMLYPDTGRHDESRLADGVDVETFAKVWIKAWETIAKQAHARGDLVFLDMEHIPRFIAGRWDYRFALSALETIKRNAPGLQTCFYNIPTFGLSNAENTIAYDAGKLPQYETIVKDNVRLFKRLINLLDYVDIGAYLLGAPWIERDLEYIPAMRRIMKRFFPHTKIMYSAWGSFANRTTADGHVDRGPETPESLATLVIPKEVFPRYAMILTANGDGVTIFDDDENRDGYFIEQLKLRSER